MLQASFLHVFDSKYVQKTSPILIFDQAYIKIRDHFPLRRNNSNGGVIKRTD
jgi:hypothetical protein